MKQGREFKTGAVTVTVDYGHDVHSITFSGRTWARIEAGKPVTIKGQGFHWEGCPDQDYWQFNQDAPGSLCIYTHDGGDVFIGHRDDGRFWKEPS